MIARATRAQSERQRVKRESFSHASANLTAVTEVHYTFSRKRGVGSPFGGRNY